MTQINIWAVLAAAISSFALSALFIDGGHHSGQFVLYGLNLGAWH